MGSDSLTKEVWYSSELRTRGALLLRGWYLMIMSPTFGTQVLGSFNPKVSKYVD